MMRPWQQKMAVTTHCTYGRIIKFHPYALVNGQDAV